MSPVPLARVTAAALLAALLLDLVGRTTGASGWWAAGAHLATAGVVVGAVGLALARRAPRRFVLAGMFALPLFALARWVRGDADVVPEPPLLALEAIGGLLLLLGGWLRRSSPPPAGPR